MLTDISVLFVSSNSSIRDAITCLEDNNAKIALVVDDDKRLLDTITDGDVRRAILAGINLDDSGSSLRIRKNSSANYSKAITAPIGTETSQLLKIIKERDVRHVPLVDDNDSVISLVTARELIANDILPIQAVVMAGGAGTRLRPLTEDVPKPMVNLGGRPMLERSIEQLRESGISRVMVTTHYKGELISDHFGDGDGFGVKIDYVQEDKPMGTAGALSQLEPSDKPLLVMNGDILTRVDFRAMLDFHVDHNADMSVAVRTHEFIVPYGVMEIENERIIKVTEKPTINHFINAGIYLLNPDIARLVPESGYYDMTELINHLVAEGKKVISFPIREYWLDIGQHSDYEQAEEDLREGKV